MSSDCPAWGVELGSELLPEEPPLAPEPLSDERASELALDVDDAEFELLSLLEESAEDCVFDASLAFIFEYNIFPYFLAIFAADCNIIVDFPMPGSPDKIGRAHV